MRSKRSVVKIAKSFQLQANKAVCVKSGVYRLSAKDGGEHCLKKMGYPKDRLVWMDTVLCGIRRKGFRTIAWRDPASSVGKILYVRPNAGASPYILTPWLKGRIPSPKVKEDMYACSQALARFHLAGRSVNIPAKGAENLLGRWPVMIRERKVVLERQIGLAKRQSRPSPIDDLLRKHGDGLLQRASQALRTFKKREYFELCERSKRKGAVLCHADSGPKNFILTKQGPSLIDFESLRLDLRMYDLYRMIRLTGKKNRWDFTLSQAILDGYRSVSKLEPFEYELLAAWLLFPQKAFRTLNKYAQAGAAEREELEKKLEKAIKFEQGIPELLRKLSDYATRGEGHADMDNG
jgi:CotS family spore coat protein